MTRDELYSLGFAKIALAWVDGVRGSELENWVDEIMSETFKQDKDE
jgi:hypothetical protein